MISKTLLVNLMRWMSKTRSSESKGLALRSKFGLILGATRLKSDQCICRMRSKN